MKYITIEGRNPGFSSVAVIVCGMAILDGTTTVFVIGDVIAEGDSFYESDIAKMKYVTIEGRNPGFCWVPDPYNLFPGPASGALGMILATLAVDLKAVFVQNKLTISASEDPERVAQDLEMYETLVVPAAVENLSTPNLLQGVCLHWFR
ncbi:unnamed protein product [Clonostachys solani]|uniref:Uncharacterized protein n=1 Tax=Clonostachys solani TaxID=160281 RepID=A0A9N9Z7B3_9HYPO|nr:unnamed protein product [Clonostachys solani]